MNPGYWVFRCSYCNYCWKIYADNQPMKGNIWWTNVSQNLVAQKNTKLQISFFRNRKIFRRWSPSNDDSNGPFDRGPWFGPQVGQTFHGPVQPTTQIQRCPASTRHPSQGLCQAALRLRKSKTSDVGQPKRLTSRRRMPLRWFWLERGDK